MVNFELFVYRNADKVLDTKGLLEEVKSILLSVSKVDHKEIQKKFHNKRWLKEKRIIPEVSWVWDAFKNNIAVSIELSLIDAVHRDFLRAMLAQKRGTLEVLVYITSTFKEPKFYNVKRDIDVFNEMLTFPIFLVGFT